MRKYSLLLIPLVHLSFVSFTACAQKAAVKETIVESSMRYLENDRIKLGIDLKLGGAVTFLSDQENGGQNMINSYDWGRQIQLSYYSGPWPYVGPNGETPTPEWSGLGWNPIQAGDAGGHRSQVIDFEKRGDNAIFVRAIPMQWPHKTGVATECEFECLYTLKDNVITMEATIVNHRSDTTQYRACSQEMPAVYTNGPWYKLVTYLGDQPFAGQPTTVVVDKSDQKGWPWVHFYTPENWVALLDDKGYGIGVFQPEVMTFNGGFHPNDNHKGFGGEKDVQTGHAAPTGKQILDHNIKWTYTTSLILGTESDIRNYAKANRKIDPQPEWNFHHSRQNWYYEGDIVDSGFPIHDGLHINFKENASLVSPVTFWKASETPYLEIEGEITSANSEMLLTVDIQPVGKSDLTDWLNWSEGDKNIAKENQQKSSNFPKAAPFRIQQPISADGSNRIYRIYLGGDANYQGAMKNLKINFSKEGQAKIKRIKLGN